MKRLKELRLKNNMTQNDVADYLGVSRVAYLYYENENRQPSIETLKRLTDLYGVSIDYLLGNEINIVPINTTDNVISMKINNFCVEGAGSCGNGKNNNDYAHDEWYDIPTEWVKGNPDDYALGYANGDSMADAHIVDGALLFFKKQNTIENNQIGLFHLNGEEYIKRYKKKDDIVLLESANTEYETIIVTKNDEFEIRGKLEREVLFFN